MYISLSILTYMCYRGAVRTQARKLPPGGGGERTARGHIIIIEHCYFGDTTSVSKRTVS